MRRHLIAASTTLLLGAAVIATPAQGADPASGSVSDDSPTVTWSGSTQAQTAGFGELGCITHAKIDPTCDYFELAVGHLTAPADDVVVSISTTNGGVAEFDLYVYTDAGTEVGRSTEFGSNESVTLTNAPSGIYVVAVQNVLSTNVANSYDGVATVTEAGGGPVLDAETPCGLESTDDNPTGHELPDPLGVAPVVGDPLAAASSVDRTERISLDVLVLRHGVTDARARDIVERAGASYDELNVDLAVADVIDVTGDPAFDTDDAFALIRAAKAHLGGARPDGVDIVEVLTATDIQQLGQYAIAGLADCIGGVAHDDRAFLVAEANIPTDLDIGPLRFYEEGDANVTAHEIGHLVGGQHHYANCAEGIQPSDLEGEKVDVSPCSLMFNSADFLGPGFGTVNGAVARGMIADHAS